MKSYFLQSLEELLTGRAYLPIYALAMQSGDNGTIIPPIILRNEEFEN